MSIFTALAERPATPPRLTGGAARKQTPEDRVLARCVHPEGTSCWIWDGNVEPVGGYGLLGGVFAHRKSYAAFVGTLIPGMEIDHLCRVRLCVNPGHLEQVTKAENNRRAWAVRDRSKCRRGHVLAETGGRNAGGACRACQRERQYARRNGAGR